MSIETSSRRLDWDPVTHYQNTDVARRYDRERFSSLAGRVFNSLERRFIRKAFSTVRPGARIVDVPCGTGRLAEVLLEDGFKICGVDIAAEMLVVAQERLVRFGDRFESRVADVRTMAAPAQPFDAALCARVLMHFPLEEQIAFVRAVAKLTKGPVVITQSLDTPYQRLRRRIKRLLGNPPPAGYPITNAEFKRLLAESGLREVRRLRPMALVSEEIILVAEHLP